MSIITVVKIHIGLFWRLPKSVCKNDISQSFRIWQAKIDNFESENLATTRLKAVVKYAVDTPRKFRSKAKMLLQN